MMLGRLFVVALLSFSLSVLGQGQLYGVLYPTQTVVIDPKTFALINIGTNFPEELQAQQESSLDEKNGVLYLLGYNDSSNSANLLGISLQKGTLVANVPLPFIEEGFIGVGMGLAFDPATGDCIVTGNLPSTASTEHDVLSVNPTDGTYKQIGTITADEDVLGGSTTLDYVNRNYYIQFAVKHGINNVTIDLFILNLDTGKVSDTLPTPFPETLNYNAKDGLIYGFGLQANSSSPTGYSRTVVKYNPADGSSVVLGGIWDYWIISSDVTALDTTNRILYGFFTEVNGTTTDFFLVGVNLDTLQVVTNPHACSEDADCPWQLQFWNQ